MTTNFWKISNLLVLGLLILICGLGTFYKHISFGLGLGDMFGYLVLYLATLTHFILTIISRKKGNSRHVFLTLFFSTFTILFILKATIWRGGEYSWNGSIFYLPCPTDIMIDNQNIKNKKLITMCSMDYYSEFSGNWNGQFLTVKTGDIQVPEELEQFIQRPISKVEIEPDFHEIFQESGTRIKFDFKKDTLQTHKEYKLAGEIRAIRNQIPVIKVKIN
jgi:hypothetical protein